MITLSKKESSHSLDKRHSLIHKMRYSNLIYCLHAYEGKKHICDLHIDYSYRAFDFHSPHTLGPTHTFSH